MWPHDTVMLPGLSTHTSPSSCAVQHAATSLVCTSCTSSLPSATGMAAWLEFVARCATGATTRSSAPVMPTMVPAGMPATGVGAPLVLPSAAGANDSREAVFSEAEGKPPPSATRAADPSGLGHESLLDGEPRPVRQ